MAMFLAGVLSTLVFSLMITLALVHNAPTSERPRVRVQRRDVPQHRDVMVKRAIGDHRGR
jgi:hypothetical protein